MPRPSGVSLCTPHGLPLSCSSRSCGEAFSSWMPRVQMEVIVARRREKRAGGKRRNWMRSAWWRDTAAKRVRNAGDAGREAWCVGGRRDGDGRGEAWYTDACGWYGLDGARWRRGNCGEELGLPGTYDMDELCAWLGTAGGPGFVLLDVARGWARPGGGG